MARNILIIKFVIIVFFVAFVDVFSNNRYINVNIETYDIEFDIRLRLLNLISLYINYFIFINFL